jgi:hypothetical protein
MSEESRAYRTTSLLAWIVAKDLCRASVGNGFGKKRPSPIDANCPRPINARSLAKPEYDDTKQKQQYG